MMVHLKLKMYKETKLGNSMGEEWLAFVSVYLTRIIMKIGARI